MTFVEGPLLVKSGECKASRYVDRVGQCAASFCHSTVGPRSWTIDYLRNRPDDADHLRVIFAVGPYSQNLGDRLPRKRKIMKKTVHALFLADKKLWKVFWLINVPIGIAFLIFSALLSHGAIETGMYTFIFVLALSYVIFKIWMAISLWMSARNVKWRIMFYLARILSAIYFIRIISIAVLAVKYAKPGEPILEPLIALEMYN